MYRFKFKCKSHLIHKSALILSVASLLLTFFKLANAMNYVGATYAIGSTLLRKTDHLRNALAISMAGCAYDFLYVIFHSSSSSWLYVKIILFAVRFSAFLFELLWITSAYCYLKQQETVDKAKEDERKVAWCENRMKIRPCERVPTGPQQPFVKTESNIAKPVPTKRVSRRTAFPNLSTTESAKTANQQRTAVSATPRSTFVAPESSAETSGDNDVRQSIVETLVAESANPSTAVSATPRSTFVAPESSAKTSGDNDVRQSIVETLVAESANPSTAVSATPRSTFVAPESSAKTSGDNDVRQSIVETLVAESANPSTAELANVEPVATEPANVEAANVEPVTADKPTEIPANKNLSPRSSATEYFETASRQSNATSDTKTDHETSQSTANLKDSSGVNSTESVVTLRSNTSTLSGEEENTSVIKNKINE